MDDPRPLAGTPLSIAVAGADGRAVAADGAEAAVALRHLLERLGTPLVGHEVKPLLTARFAEEPDAAPTPVAFDTQIAAYLVNAALRAQKIADVVAERLDLVLPPAAAGLPPTAVAGLEALAGPRRPAHRWSRRSATRAPSACSPRSSCRWSRSWPAWRRPASPSTGTRWPRSSASSPPRSTRLEGEIYAAVGHQFTIGSPKQLGEILFVELRLPKGRKTKTGYSTDATVLEELRGVHPVIEPVLDWRIYTKLRSTYVEALPNLIGPDGRLHTLFHQAVAATGRLSSSDPNLQNIPIRTPLGRRIRHAFVAGLAGHDARRRGLQPDRAADPRPRLGRRAPRRRVRPRRRHPPRDGRPRAAQGPRRTSRSDERSMAKMVNFGLAYGMSDFGLSSRAGISRQDAQEFINSYFAAYGGISRYMLHIRETAKDAGLRGHAAGAATADPGAQLVERGAAGRRASGWRSTCRSRARPPTSSRSR